MTTTFERLCTLLVTDPRLPPDRMTPDMSLDSLGIDSLGTVELLWNVEDTFKIKLPTVPVELLTLGDVVGYIDELVARQGMRMAQTPPVAPSLRAS